MQDLSQRKPPQLNIKAEDTSPTGENGALVWSTSQGRHITYNQNAGRWGNLDVYPALASVKIPGVVYNTFLEYVSTTTLALVANNQYFAPFYLTEDRSITSMGYEVTTAAASGVASVGIYTTQVVSGVSVPYQLITSAILMNITTTGLKTATTIPSTTLRAGILYWASILVTAGVTMRACVSPTRMLLTALTSPLVSVRITNNSGNLIDPAPTSGYTGNASAPILIYT